MNKQVKLIIIIILLLLACFIFYKSSYTRTISSNGGTPKSEIQWQAKYPKIFNNLGKYKIKSTPYLSSLPPQKLSNSQQALAGVVTNQFGIRDDILEYIIKTVPSDNDLALRAAIKSAYHEQLIYYGNLTQKEAIKLADEGMLIKTCLSDYLPNDGWLKLSRGIDQLMRNTKARDDHMWDIDNKVFGYQYISSGLSVAAEKEACKKGDF